MTIVKGTRNFEISVRNVRYSDGSDVEVVIAEGDKRATGYLAKDRIQITFNIKIMHNNVPLTAISLTPDQHAELKTMVNAVADKPLPVGADKATKINKLAHYSERD